jgi:4-amino-4-deoxy-L-arabinose transferase-like glycosyltransferase
VSGAIFSRQLKFAIRNYVVVFAGCLLFHVLGTWSLPLIDRDEPRFAEASREMIQRGDYIVPYFNNQLRLDKPPLAYWAQTASYRVFGENDFAARFPSAIAAALVALSIFAWGSRIAGKRLGLWSAIIFTLSLQTFIHAKAAVADMWLVLFVTLAHRAGYELLRDVRATDDRKRSTPNAQRPTLNSEDLRWWFTFYLALGLAFLAKGPVGWTPLLTVASVRIFEREVVLSKRFKFVRGIVLMLAIVACWGIPAVICTHGEFFTVGIGRHVIGRSFGAMEGHGANSLGMYLVLLPFYFVTIFVSFFPWSIKLPPLAKKLWSSHDKIDNYLIAGTAVIFLIFTFVKTKLPHYILPALPLLSLLLARHFIDQTQLLKRAAVAAASLYFVVVLVAPVVLTQSLPAAQLFKASRDYLRADMEFGVVTFEEPSVVWYFRSRVQGWMTRLRPTDASQFMQRSGPRFIVLPTKLARDIFASAPADWKMFSAHGLNIAKGTHVDLTLVLKSE